MEIKDLGEFISTSISSLDKYKEILLQAAQVLGKSQAKLDDEYSKRAPLASTEEKVQEEVAVEEVKQEEQVVEETPVAQEEVKEEKVEEVEKEAPKPAPKAEPQAEQPKYVVTDFGRGPKGPRPQNGQKPPFNQNGQRPPFDPNRKPGFNQNGPRPPFDPNRKPGFNQNGKPGFKQQPSNFVASDIVEKKDTQRTKKNPPKAVVEPKEKGSLSKRDLFKRGYEYDSSLEAMDDDDSIVRIRGNKKEKKHEPIQRVEITEAVLTSDIVPLKTFSEKIGKPAADLVKKFFELGKMITINSSITFEEAELIAMDYGITLTLEKEKTAEDKLEELINTNDTNEKMVKRPPIVTIMGHVDHGKTSLLDYIRKTNVIATEAGGITQHIGAYTIDVNGEKITFLDTPGHEAFTAMRKRGAQVTDIAIIVVAADDAIMPQTIEAINHAKEAGVSIIVAANKIDKTNGDYSKVLQQLPNYDLLPEEWGGDTIVCPICAKTGQGVDKLLESVLLVAEMLDLKATKKVPASGSIIEARLDKSIGPVATVLVKNGTLKIKDFLVAGTNICRVRAMTDCTGKACKEAYPSYAVQVQGFQSVPNAGDTFIVVKDEKLAKHVAEERIEKERNAMQATSTRTLEDLLKEQSGEVKVLAVIIKSDVQGTCEAVKQALLKLNEERAEDNVKIKVIHAGVGAINESDIMLADTTNAIVLGFNVRPESKAKAQAERDGIDIRTYSIIYDAIDDINAALSGMIAPTYKETALGMVEIRDLFKITGVGMIAGCYVLEGKIARNCGYRLLRDNLVIHTGKIASLKRMKDDAKEVAAGYECGVGLDNYADFKVGDILETFLLEEEKHE
ncbi:MAG: translation initiation factor IF-2 [Clostridia bacterium]|nr:translation initiation factor IF-2 [Clostridia bacterium]